MCDNIKYFSLIVLISILPISYGFPASPTIDMNLIPKNDDSLYIIDDIIFEKGQITKLFGLSERNGIPPFESMRWPNGQLAYALDSSIITPGSLQETILLEAIAKFNAEMNGCVSIV